MQTDFKEYLEKKKAQKIIDKAAKKYKNKSVVLYGAGFFASDIVRNYDLSKLNILGVADMKFQDDNEGDFYGFKKIGSYDLLEMDFDAVLITTYDDEAVKEFLIEDLFQGENKKIKIDTLVKMNLIEYIKHVFSES